MTPTTTLRHEVPRQTRREMTTELLGQAAKATGPERDALIEQVIVINTSVARTMARRYADRGIPLEDLEQVACMALVRAARKFNGDLAEDFLTYAVPTIRGEIKRYFRDHGWTVRPPRRVQELQTSVLRVRDEAREESGRTLTPAEIAERLDVSENDVVEALTAEGCFTPLSLDAPSGSAEDGASLGELIPDGDVSMSAAEARLLLAPALSKLTEREQLILKLRFVEDMTQEQIGKRIGVTQMQVSRLLNSIIARLREELDPAEQPAAEQVATSAKPASRSAGKAA